MSNPQKNKLRALMKFKNDCINTAVGKLVVLKKREFTEKSKFIYEDIYVGRSPVGTFKFERATGKLTFEEKKREEGTPDVISDQG